MSQGILKELRKLSKAGNHQGVVALGQKTLDNNPDKSHIAFITCAIACAHMELGNLDDAETILLAMGVESNSFRYVDALNAYAGLQILCGDLNKAKTFYQKGLDVTENKKSRQGLENLSWLNGLKPLAERRAQISRAFTLQTDKAGRHSRTNHLRQTHS